MAGREHQSYLDSFRAFAIAGVILTHTVWISSNLSPWLDNLAHFGSKGVQLFFYCQWTYFVPEL